MVEGYVERNLSVAELVAEGIDREVVEQVVGLIDRAEYKRRQAAPGIKITAKAFGIGRRYPIVADYRGLARNETQGRDAREEHHMNVTSRGSRRGQHQIPGLRCLAILRLCGSYSPGFIFLHFLIIFSMALLIFLSALSGLSEKTSTATPRQTSFFVSASQMSMIRVPCS